MAIIPVELLMPGNIDATVWDAAHVPISGMYAVTTFEGPHTFRQEPSGRMRHPRVILSVAKNPSICGTKQMQRSFVGRRGDPSGCHASAERIPRGHSPPSRGTSFSLTAYRTRSLKDCDDVDLRVDSEFDGFPRF